MVLAIILLIYLLPLFNSVANSHIALPIKDWMFWLKISGLVIITGCISGSYPALFLSSLKPVQVLKGTLKFGSAALSLRKSLVIFQFILSAFFITGTIIINRQIHYIQSTNIGFTKENLIYVPLDGELTNKYNIFKEEALKSKGIRSISRISSLPNDIKTNTSSIQWPGKDPNNQTAF